MPTSLHSQVIRTVDTTTRRKMTIANLPDLPHGAYAAPNSMQNTQISAYEALNKSSLQGDCPSLQRQSKSWHDQGADVVQRTVHNSPHEASKIGRRQRG